MIEILTWLALLTAWVGLMWLGGVVFESLIPRMLRCTNRGQNGKEGGKA